MSNIKLTNSAKICSKASCIVEKKEKIFFSLVLVLNECHKPQMSMTCFVILTITGMLGLMVFVCLCVNFLICLHSQ
jgi:hypothetical protein